jgi:serine/threonine protein kinase
MQHTGSNHFCDQCGSANTLTAKFCRGCGQHMSSSPTSLVPIQSPGTPSTTGQTGMLIGTLRQGQYLIVRPLGQGGMGAVYLAKDLAFGGRQIAIKEMGQSHLQPDELTDAADAFKREALLLSSLKHNSLPGIYAHFEDNGRWYLVMDYIEGETLKDRLEQAPNQRIAMKDVIEWGLALCDVLSYLHTRKPPIIFRDLKPANVMLTPDEHVYLVDFGIARHFKPGQMNDTTALGSPGYAPPEQYGRSQTTTRADIYALGATLHQLLTGDDPSNTPFQFAPITGRNVPELQGHPFLVDLNALVMCMVNAAAAQRPDSIMEVKRELERLATSSSQPRSASPYQRQGSPSVSSAVKGMSAPQGASSQRSSRQVTLLCAPKDTSLALHLESHLLAAAQSAGLPLVVRHNADSSAGTVIARVWADRLQNSDVFVPLVSADLWGSPNIWGYVQEVIHMKKAECILPVLARPCSLDQGKFQGLNVVPNKPVSSFSGAAAKENAWLSVVNHIIQAVRAIKSTHQPSLAAPVSVASQVLPAQPLSVLPSPSSTRRISMPQSQPTISSYVAPSSTSSFQQPTLPATSLAAPPVSQEWEITLLFAPEDKNWITPMIRIFTIMQRTLLSSLGVRFLIHRGTEGLQNNSDECLRERIASSRLTLALVSPDFLASDWIERYDEMNVWLMSRGQYVIPVLLRDCKWEGGVPLPRDEAIKKISNDTAWSDVSREITAIFRHYYPSEVPGKPDSSWR